MKSRTYPVIALMTFVLANPCIGCSSRPSSAGNEMAARKQRIYDEALEEAITPSSDLDTDRKRMWETVPGLREESGKSEVCPVSAINAAGRVFARVRLEGKRWDEVADLIGFRPRPGYRYDVEFYPTEKDVVMYRFDCGSYGWQFNIVFDADQRVREVVRQWIH